MELIIRSTSKIVNLNGVECRQWEGRAKENTALFNVYLVAIQPRCKTGEQMCEAELNDMGNLAIYPIPRGGE